MISRSNGSTQRRPTGLTSVSPSRYAVGTYTKQRAMPLLLSDVLDRLELVDPLSLLLSEDGLLLELAEMLLELLDALLLLAELELLDDELLLELLDSLDSLLLLSLELDELLALDELELLVLLLLDELELLDDELLLNSSRNWCSSSQLSQLGRCVATSVKQA